MRFTTLNERQLPEGEKLRFLETTLEEHSRVVRTVNAALTDVWAAMVPREIAEQMAAFDAKQGPRAAYWHLYKIFLLGVWLGECQLARLKASPAPPVSGAGR